MSIEPIDPLTEKEFIRFGWAVGFLKRKYNPFKMQYQEHFVVQPKELTAEDDDKFSKLLAGIGWSYSHVTIFKKPSGEAFYAWKCLPTKEPA